VNNRLHSKLLIMNGDNISVLDTVDVHLGVILKPEFTGTVRSN